MGGGLKIVLVLGHIPVEIFLLVKYFFDITHTNIEMLLKGQANFLNYFLPFLF